MKVMIVGGGGREHALAWKIKQSPRVSELFVAPGNAGTASIAHNLDIKATDIEGLVNAAKQYQIDLTVVGPETPLAAGIANQFDRNRLRLFGPTWAAAKLETSKVFAKKLMYKYRIPTAFWGVFINPEEAKDYVRRQGLPAVIKADGLAGGKGVIIAKTEAEADEAISDIMEKKVFGEAGDRLVVEKFLEGPEVSLLVFTDGAAVLPMVAACDYKKAEDGNKGPNTGGMGGFSPPSFFTPALLEQVRKTIIDPTVRGMSMELTPYKGVLYVGLMITKDGPKVLEFNARFGDPEAQVILPRMKTDLVGLMEACVDGGLARQNIEWTSEVSVGVTLASSGYPGEYQTGVPITGLDGLDAGVLAFHAGTKLAPDGSQVVTDGGRVLTVVAKGNTIAEARTKVYGAIPKISFSGCFYRKDIAAGI